MGAYAGMLSERTYLRLKRTNAKKLLVCHDCRKQFIVGDIVIWAAGAMRKKYHLSCADRVNIVYTIPDNLKDKIAPVKENGDVDDDAQ